MTDKNSLPHEISCQVREMVKQEMEIFKKCLVVRKAADISVLLKFRGYNFKKIHCTQVEEMLGDLEKKYHRQRRDIEITTTS